ncbi:MAG: hypothetical protein JXR70_00120, partial [Spirochaetales bacterium]|nr:hypothetical protein [Spirochaetales bacterium]
MIKKLSIIFVILMLFASFTASAQCQSITSDYSHDGQGSGCVEMTCFGNDANPWESYINSWNMDSLTINGVNITNQYKGYAEIAKPANGVYRVEYKASYAWSHFEIKGVCSGGTTITDPPTETPTPTPTPTPTETIGTGDTKVYVYPANQTITSAGNFTISINIDAPSQTVAAYGFDLTFNSSVIRPNESVGQYGVEKGSNGFFAASNLSGNTLTMTGFDVNGVGPGSALQLVKITFATVANGTSSLGLSINNLTNANAEAVNASSANGSVTVNTGGGPSAKIYIAPSATTIGSIGGTATVAINADIPSGNVAAYGFIVSFDSSIVSTTASSVKAGSKGFLAAAALN